MAISVILLRQAGPVSLFLVIYIKPGSELPEVSLTPSILHVYKMLPILKIFIYILSKFSVPKYSHPGVQIVLVLLPEAKVDFSLVQGGDLGRRVSALPPPA